MATDRMIPDDLRDPDTPEEVVITLMPSRSTTSVSWDG
jgi:hypothetical protein